VAGFDWFRPAPTPSSLRVTDSTPRPSPQAGARANRGSSASVQTLGTKSTAARGQGSRPTRGDGGRPFEGQLSDSCRSLGRTRRATASPRSERPGSSVTTACHGWRQAARSSARRRPSSARAAASATCRFALMVMSRPRVRTPIAAVSAESSPQSSRWVLGVPFLTRRTCRTRGGEVDLVPAQITGLGGAQSVPPPSTAGTRRLARHAVAGLAYIGRPRHGHVIWPRGCADEAHFTNRASRSAISLASSCSCSAIRSAVLASSRAPENAAACSTNPAMFCRTLQCVFQAR
jgi:hypothetical protein